MIFMAMEQLAFAKQDGVVEHAGIQAEDAKIEAEPAMATDNENIERKSVHCLHCESCFCDLKPSYR